MTTARVRTRIPLLLRWTHRYRLCGTVVDVEHLWTTAAAWRRRDDGERAGWVVSPIGPFVIAERISS